MKLREGAGTHEFLTRQIGTLAEQFGLVATSVTQGCVEAQLQLRPWMNAPNGFVHAATIVLLADTCAGYACFAHLSPDAKGFSTLELKVNFLGSARAGALRARAVADHLGRSTQVWSVTAVDEQDHPVALFRCTQMVLG